MKILRGDQRERFKRFLEQIENLKRKCAAIEMLNRGINEKEISRRTGLLLDTIRALNTQSLGKTGTSSREKEH